MIEMFVHLSSGTEEGKVQPCPVLQFAESMAFPHLQGFRLAAG